MFAVAFHPAREVRGRGQHVALIEVAGAVRKNEVLDEIAGVPRPRYEVIDVGIVPHRAPTVEAAVLLHVLERVPCRGEVDPCATEQEQLQMGRAADRERVPGVRADVLHPRGSGEELYQRAESPQVEGNAGKQRDALAAASFVEEGNVLAPQGLQLPERHLLDDLRDAADEAWPAPVPLGAFEVAESLAFIHDARHDRGLAAIVLNEHGRRAVCGTVGRRVRPILLDELPERSSEFLRAGRADRRDIGE